jgi:hypothetical protein
MWGGRGGRHGGAHHHGGHGGYGFPNNYWWWWRAGYSWPYGPYEYGYPAAYRTCCVDAQNGILFCAGQSYPVEVVRVAGTYAQVVTQSGLSWYPLCGT